MFAHDCRSVATDLPVHGSKEHRGTESCILYSIWRRLLILRVPLTDDVESDLGMRWRTSTLDSS